MQISQTVGVEGRISKSENSSRGLSGEISKAHALTGKSDGKSTGFDQGG